MRKVQTGGTWDDQQPYLPGEADLFAASPSAVTFMNIWTGNEKKGTFSDSVNLN